MTPRTNAPGRSTPEHLGWREWAALPDLGIEAVKAKLDTGARTSSLHAFAIKRFDRDGIPMVRFEIHPHQRSSEDERIVEAPMLEERWIRNSGGERELRPVIETTVRIGERQWTIELTLSRRDQMGFRMLLGRQALRGWAVVDPGKSFRAGRRKRLASREKTRSKRDPTQTEAPKSGRSET